MSDYVNAPALTVHYPDNITAGSADDLVEDRFTESRGQAIQALQDARSFLDVLKSVFSGVSMPPVNVSYDFQEADLTSDITQLRPTPPTDEQLTPAAVALPTEPVLEEITLQDLPAWPEEPAAPGAEADFVYQETPYQSEMAERIRTAIEAYIENGGTGLPAAVEEAIWQRAKDRLEVDRENAYDEAESYFAARGFCLPPGALAARLAEARNETTRRLNDTNLAISEYQAKLELDARKYFFSAGLQLDTAQREHFDRVATRALEKAKSAVLVILQAYATKVDAYGKRIEALKGRAAVDKVRVEAVTELNKNRIAQYEQGIERFKAQLTAELSIIENLAKVYGFKVAGYEADARVAATELSGQIEAFKARLAQANNQTQLSLKEAELVLQGYLGGLGITSDAAKGGAQIAAQIAASALSSVHASATIGYNVSRGEHHSTTHSTNVSNAASLSEAHSYDETKTGAE